MKNHIYDTVISDSFLYDFELIFISKMNMIYKDGDLFIENTDHDFPL